MYPQNVTIGVKQKTRSIVLYRCTPIFIVVALSVIAIEYGDQ